MLIPKDIRRFFESRQVGSDNPRSGVVKAFGAGALVVIALLLLYSELFGPPTKEDTGTFEFILTPEQVEGDLASVLEDAGIIRHGIAFQIAHASLGNRPVRPGGYKLNLSMDAWTVTETLSEAPYLAWITIPDGYRKEQVGELLSEMLTWPPELLAAWNALENATSTELGEGYFYPDTYLIPSDQTPEQIAARFKGRFEDAIAPYIEEANNHTLSWNQIVTLASIVERESAKNDKPLVAGILLNRIERNMLLQADATLQYIKGEPGNWWEAPTSDDKYLESPYNTYKHLGLPPTPIASPSLQSILAVLRPDTTSCLYYLHDSKGRIHCSRNYAGHVDNVNRYLK